MHNEIPKNHTEKPSFQEMNTEELLHGVGEAGMLSKEDALKQLRMIVGILEQIRDHQVTHPDIQQENT